MASMGPQAPTARRSGFYAWNAGAGLGVDSVYKPLHLGVWLVAPKMLISTLWGMASGSRFGGTGVDAKDRVGRAPANRARGQRDHQ